ncbi:MAG: FixH family protein, partial [Cyclobacteriaceae bacterium]
MKFNWGHGITIFFSLFVAFMVFMVVKSHEVNIDLVAEDYYAREIAYQSQIEKMENTIALKQKVNISQKSDRIEVTFPNEAIPSSGKLLLYRPSDKQYDRTREIVPEHGRVQSIDTKELPSGYYSLQLDWQTGEKPFYLEQNVF